MGKTQTLTEAKIIEINLLKYNETKLDFSSYIWYFYSNRNCNFKIKINKVNLPVIENDPVIDTLRYYC